MMNERRICEKMSSDIYFPSGQNSEFPSRRDLGVFGHEVKKILPATPPKLRREVVMCGNAAN